MEFVFLGTAAAEGIPAAYCRCAQCEGVRKRGGVEIKSRSALRIGAQTQIDISPDNHWQMLRHGLDMYDVRHLLITHTHADHFGLTQLTDKTMAEVRNGEPLVIYMSRPGKEYVFTLRRGLHDERATLERLESWFPVVALEYFSRYAVGDFTVETVKGNHTGSTEEEKSINYLVTAPGGRSLFYALDTGYYLEETWEFLEDKHTDLLVMECTFGARTDRGEFPSDHLDIASFLRMLERMSAIGFIDGGTTIFATHVNPHQGLAHREIQERFDQSPVRVTVAYDGLRTEL